MDTDQIIPKQFLKRIERTGYGDFLFFDWRRNAAGDPAVSYTHLDVYKRQGWDRAMLALQEQ